MNVTIRTHSSSSREAQHRVERVEREISSSLGLGLFGSVVAAAAALPQKIHIIKLYSLSLCMHCLTEIPLSAPVQASDGWEILILTISMLYRWGSVINERMAHSCAVNGNFRVLCRPFLFLFSRSNWLLLLNGFLPQWIKLGADLLTAFHFYLDQNDDDDDCDEIWENASTAIVSPTFPKNKNYRKTASNSTRQAMQSMTSQLFSCVMELQWRKNFEFIDLWRWHVNEKI